MRLASFEPLGSPGDVRTGVVVGDSPADHEVIDLTDPPVGLPADMATLLAAGPAAMEAVARAIDQAGPRRRPLDQVRLLAPVANPPKILAIGMNYRAHVAEMGGQPPPHQYWFNKQRTAICGPGDPIVIPSVSEQVDYEGELAMVIGRRCHHVPAERAMEVVAGVTVLNDVSVRDWQWHSPTFTMGKSFDSHAPTGPWLATLDEVGDIGKLGLRTWVNDELRQDSNTEDLIFTCTQMIEYLTTVFPLEPGDIVSTGTPAGVAAGMNPPRWLVPGDVVRIEIEGIGALVNPVTAGGTPRTVGLD